MLGTRVVTATSSVGGYSPCLASRADLADGRTVFLKGVSPAQNPDSPALVRQELAVVARLPSEAPAPCLLHEYDDGEWVVGVFEHVDGRLPRLPWARDELAAVLEAATRLGDLRVPDSLRCHVPTSVDHMARLFDKWPLVAREPPVGLDPWAATHLDELAALESGWREAVEGTALVHHDVRSDNTLIEPSGRVVFVDWPHTCTGAPWIDVVMMLASVALEGGGEPEAVLRLAGVDADAGAVDVLVAALSGYFVWQGGRPDPPGLPTVRAFQRAQAEVTLRWLRSRLGDPEPQ